MKHRFKHIVKSAKEVSLTSDEKDDLRRSIVAHLESHPLTAESGTFTVQKPISCFHWTGGYFGSKRMLAVPCIFMLLILVSAGVSFASTSALPGNILYPIKILNEKINSSFISDPVKRVKVLTVNAMNRLEEAEKLYLNGKLDEATELKLAKSFETDSGLVGQSLTALQKTTYKESGMQAGLKFREDLDRHHKILASFIKPDESKKTNEKLIEGVNRVIAQLDIVSGSASAKEEVKKEVKVTVPKKILPKANVGSVVNNSASLNADATATITVEKEEFGEDDVQIIITTDKEEKSDDDESEKIDDEGNNDDEGVKEDDTNTSVEINLPSIKVEVKAGGDGGTGISIPSFGL
jgi:hypothetical protein